MFGINAVNGAPFLMEQLHNHRWEVTGLIAITGGTTGIIALRMHHILVEKLLDKSGLNVSSPEERHELLNSLVGEVINIICGNALLEVKGYKINISVPVIVQGENHRIAWPTIAPVVGIPFRTNQGDFEVDVCFKT